MADKTLEKTAKEIEQLNLPIGYYVVDLHGKFIGCDAQVRQILEMPEESPINANITDFYADPSKRKDLIKKLDEAEENKYSVLKEYIRFKLKNKEIWVKDHCRSIRDKEGNKVGFLGFLVEEPELKHSQDFLDSLPVGVYELDKDDKIIKINDALVKILGYESKEELVGKNVRVTYTNRKDADKLKEELIEKKAVINYWVELKRKDGEPIYTLVSCFVKLTPTNEIPTKKEYSGREGILVDISKEENYHKMLDSIYLGTYLLSCEREDEIIRDCNQSFMKMFEYDDRKEIIGKNIKELYANPQTDYPRFLEKLREADQKEEPLNPQEETLKTKNGHHFSAEVSGTIIRDGVREKVGRAGVVRDISDDVALRNLRRDMGNVLHVFSASLVRYKFAISNNLKFLEPDPFRELSAEEIFTHHEQLKPPLNKLIESLGELLQERQKVPDSNSILPEERWEELVRCSALLTDYEYKMNKYELWNSEIRDICFLVLRILKHMKRGIPREITKKVKEYARELARLCILISLHLSLDSIFGLDYTVRSFREQVGQQLKTAKEIKIYPIKEMLEMAKTNNEEFAAGRKVQVKYRNVDEAMSIKVEQGEVVRALSNLLNNAIKYSWSKPNGEPVFVYIDSISEGGMALISIENYGVPIKKDEKDNIFKYGFRGSLSGGRGRVGTGLGLFDAQRIARSYSGDITIDSRPTSGHDCNDYSHPFITTVTFKMPLYLGKGSE